MEEEVMRKHYERTPKDILINLLVESRKQVDKLQKKNKERKQEIERLNNIINELQDKVHEQYDEIESLKKTINKLENLIKEDIISNLCEIENKRIGYGQTEVDKIWLNNLWGFKTYIIAKYDEALKGEDKE